MTTTDADEEAIELGKTSARPVVCHRTSCQNHVSSSSSEESGDDNPSLFAFELERPKQSRSRSSSTRLPKRRKTFGGQSRRPLSLLLSNGNNMLSSPFLERERETSVAQRASPDPEINLDPRPASQPILRPLQPRDKDVESMRGTATKSIISPCHFANKDHERLNRWDTPQRPTATSSIQQAREYFAHLDSVHQLQIDSSFSPSPCRPITRTTRKVQLSSPGFVDEYAKYARASRELGVTPLATREYAKSRRQFFRKAELFDGFVDS